LSNDALAVGTINNFESPRKLSLTQQFAQDFNVNHLLRLLAKLPLNYLHSMGSILGLLLLRFDKRAQLQIQKNLSLAASHLKINTSETAVKKNLGARIVELPWLWLRPYQELAAKISLSDAAAACVSKPGATIFLTPHLGSFEVTAMYIASVRPITVMYRTPKVSALLPLMLIGRSKARARAVPADLSGVRAMLSSLKQGDSIGLLPDQVPSKGEGVAVPFLGQTAMTMSLVYSLAQKTRARVVMSVAVFQAGQFHLQFEELHLPMDNAVSFLSAMNQALEQVIAQHPEHYLWTYNRFKGTQ
jgi:KDO2-lipid IV(A) lauroyltransferase